MSDNIQNTAFPNYDLSIYATNQKNNSASSADEVTDSDNLVEVVDKKPILNFTQFKPSDMEPTLIAQSLNYTSYITNEAQNALDVFDKLGAGKMLGKDINTGDIENALNDLKNQKFKVTSSQTKKEISPGELETVLKRLQWAIKVHGQDENLLGWNFRTLKYSQLGDAYHNWDGSFATDARGGENKTPLINVQNVMKKYLFIKP
jgi:hypothetical protein